MRYFCELSYKGTAYNGWQRQTNAPSVEQTVEDALSRLLGVSIMLTGAGRTDTGVHASFYVAHFDCDAPLDCEALRYHLNSVLPFDIAVNNIYQVADSAHARFDALQREYSYHIVTVKEPFRRETSWQLFLPLDVDAMNHAAEMLTKFTDFTSFAKLHGGNKTNICHVSKAEWTRISDTEIVFTIRADRFLRNMVRALVGTLVDVGRGKITPDEFGEIIEARDLSRASSSAPAEGLFLTDIVYPENIKKYA